MRAWALAFVLLLSCATVVSAQERAPRTFGAGFTFGVGAAQWTDYQWAFGDRSSGLVISAGALELMGFVNDHFAIDVSFQLWPALVAAAFDSVELGGTMFFEWSIGEDVRFLIGPGIGGYGHTNAQSRDPGGGEVHFAGELGIELLAGNAYDVAGVRAMTRPWLAIGNGAHGMEMGGGAMIELGAMFYAL